VIFPSNRVRIMVATKPIDFRKGHDGLAALVKNELHKDPFTGTVFVFRSRRANRQSFRIQTPRTPDRVSVAPAFWSRSSGTRWRP
jgi:transposase